MSDAGARLIAECRRIAAMSEEPGRTTRRFLTAAIREVHEHLRARMEALGMAVRVDAAGNLRGLWRPANATRRRVLIGSHVDSVPDAGAFDGVLGVVIALELVARSKAAQLPLSIEVIAFSEEEGVRFGVPFIGSRAVAGRLDAALLDRMDANGVTVADAIRAFGLDPKQIGESALDDDVACFFEVHIEQGPLLEAEMLSLAAVTAIAGQTRLAANFAGKANHAGTTPMKLRADALAGAAEWISTVERVGLSTEGLVATVGKIEAEPNAGNVIAGKATVSLDVRHARDAVRLHAVAQLTESALAIASRRGLRFESRVLLEQTAVPMDERITSFVADAIEAAGLPVKMMTSGAGHDAMILASRVPTAMLFVHSPGGLSHHPDETVREADVDAALRVGNIFLERLAAEFR